MDPKDDEWFEAAYAQLVSDPAVQQAARLEAGRLAAGTNLHPQASDVQGSRNYLRKCVFGMSVTEVQQLTVAEAGQLWGRGAYGSALYRYRKQKRKRQRHLPKPPAQSRSSSDRDT